MKPMPTNSVYSLWDRVFYRNDLILFLRNMPYREPPAVLRRYVAELMGRQIEDISQFEATQRRNFAEQKGMVFLFRMVDFLLPEDRRAIEEKTQQPDQRGRGVLMGRGGVVYL